MSPQVARARATVALGLALVSAGIAFTAALLVWQQISVRTDRQLCDVVYSFVARSGASSGKPGSPGYAYYKAHPGERAAADQQNQSFLDDLPCKPKETP